MVGIALTTAAVAAALAGVAVATRRRRGRRALRLDTMPAGVKHLAASVGELSDLGMHLSAATRALGSRRRRGVLLGLR